MRIVFMGTPEFAQASLEALVQSRHEVVAVVTAPDRKAGRGQKLRKSAVKEYAESMGIPVLQPDKLKDENFLQALRSYQADFFAVVAFRMLPEVVWAMPPKGTVNIHASLLPDYRGAAPINWAVINGERESGVSSFYINERIDEGDLIAQKRVPILDTDTAGSLHDKLMLEGAALLVETANAIEENKANRIAQKQSGESPKLAPKIFKEDTYLPFTASRDQVHNHIRGLSPYPAALAKWEQEGQSRIFKIFASSPFDDSRDRPLGSLFEQNDRLILQLSDGTLALNHIQVEGKRAMTAEEFLRGNQLTENARLV